MNIQKAVENHHFSWENPLFRLGHFPLLFVCSPEGIEYMKQRNIQTPWDIRVGNQRFSDSAGKNRWMPTYPVYGPYGGVPLATKGSHVFSGIPDIKAKYWMWYSHLYIII